MFDGSSRTRILETYISFLFVTFIFTMTIIFMNLITGLALDDIQKIAATAECKKLTRYVRIICSYIHIEFTANEAQHKFIDLYGH